MNQKPTRCRSCQAIIRWVRNMETDKLMPLDPDPDPNGNVELVELGGRTVAVVHGQPTLDPGDRYVPHFSSCPDSDAWRSR